MSYLFSLTKNEKNILLHQEGNNKKIARKIMKLNASKKFYDLKKVGEINPSIPDRILKGNDFFKIGITIRNDKISLKNSYASDFHQQDYSIVVATLHEVLRASK